jgi:hypothetical protein
MRLQQDMPIHMTMDEVLEYVDKNPIVPHLTGDISFNERHQVIVDKYLEAGHYMGHMIDPAYTVDPMLKYRRDAFWFQQVQLLQEMNPNALKAYFSQRPDAIELLKMLEQDMLDEDLE